MSRVYEQGEGDLQNTLGWGGVRAWQDYEKTSNLNERTGETVRSDTSEDIKKGGKDRVGRIYRKRHCEVFLFSHSSRWCTASDKS